MRIFACLLFILSIAFRAHGAEPARPAVGAIRWDGWHSDNDADNVGKAVAKSLGPPEWHYRIPFFGAVGADGRVSVNGDRPEVMEREIAFAAAGHLDYWAFLAYPEGDPMNRSFELYLASPHRKDIRFCMISEASRW